jgi:hypothetical protein
MTTMGGNSDDDRDGSNSDNNRGGSSDNDNRGGGTHSSSRSSCATSGGGTSAHRMRAWPGGAHCWDSGSLSLGCSARRI